MKGRDTVCIHRRAALKFALAGALTPVLASRPIAAQDAIPPLIAPPDGTMAYRRAVTRELVDGQTFAVARAFDVRFAPTSGGFILRGAQSEVQVDAPSALSEFAALERGRDESALFPIALDAFGRIRDQDGHYGSDAALGDAVSETIARLQEQRLAENEQDALAQFVAAFHSAGQRVAAVLPVDLFAPSEEMRTQTRALPLPFGAEGQIETTFTANADGATGLMRSATRQIVTRAEGTSRRTVESWTLSPK
ncbi:hypothetical protein [Aurantiacibacter aquimixticola]|uniref:DUF4908 domain-containing protein n=1 Tax=Aurantiacibacter aquimixticola TaxID=1958945 RepID=A0A419RUS8_9SPHN|nr:hypothetical protein [Aurantiacibacter aquimixticola]RJY09547.1 hypothetical protein D6201_09420 [Aurantiacibacter aquimixticola]